MRLKLRTKIFWGYVIGVTLFSCVITLFITHRVYHKKEVLKQNVRYTLQAVSPNNRIICCLKFERLVIQAIISFLIMAIPSIH